MTYNDIPCLNIHSFDIRREAIMTYNVYILISVILGE